MHMHIDLHTRNMCSARLGSVQCCALCAALWRIRYAPRYARLPTHIGEHGATRRVQFKRGAAIQIT